MPSLDCMGWTISKLKEKKTKKPHNSTSLQTETENWGGGVRSTIFFPIMHLCRNVENKVDISRLKSTYGDNVKRRA